MYALAAEADACALIGACCALLLTMIELASADVLHLAFYVALVTGNFSASFLAPLAGLPLFLAVMYGVCSSELTAYPVVLVALLPLAVALGGLVGAAVALAMRLPPYLYRMGVPSVLQVVTSSDGVPYEFVWRTRLPMLVYIFGLMWLARGIAGLARGCTGHSTLLALGALAFGALICGAGLAAAVYLARYAEQRLGESLDAVFLVCYTLVLVPPVVYFLLQSRSVGAAFLLLGLLLVAILVCVCIESRSLVSKADDVRLAGPWRTTAGALRRWGIGLFVPLAFAWFAGWLAGKLVEGADDERVVYRSSITLAALGAASVILIGLYAALFCTTPLADSDMRSSSLEPRQAPAPSSSQAQSSAQTSAVNSGYNYAMNQSPQQQQQ
jgi:hypothetical protein